MGNIRASMLSRSSKYLSRFVRSVSTTTPIVNKLVFVEASGEERIAFFETGDTILDAAKDNDIPIEGACGGECACSTCHVIFEKYDFDQLPKADEDEEDILDFAIGLTNTSRLGCQIVLSEKHEGIRIRLPDETQSVF